MESDLLCLVCANNSMDAILVIDQGDIDLIRGGEEVEMLPESARLRSLKGTIALENISKAEMKESPAHLAAQAGGALETKMDASGKMMPVSVSYQARVPLEEHDLTLRSGYRGQAKIHLAWKSLGWRLARVIMKTFHFEF
jgi:putative peptide zinc metalloprotease protein